MFSIRNLFALILSLGLAGPLVAQDAQAEVHSVGVYEGNVRTGDTIHGPEVKVEVRRPGETVTLVLGSYEPVRFLLDVDRNTSLRDIFVHGHGMNRSEIYVNGAQVRPRHIAADRWSVATSMNQKDAMGMVWDGARDRLILSVGLHRNGSLMECTEADGLRQMAIGVRVNDLPGYLDMFDPGNGPLAPLVPIAIEGDKLLLRTSPDRFARPQQIGGASRTYMIDVMTGEAALVAYSD